MKRFIGIVAFLFGSVVDAGAAYYQYDDSPSVATTYPWIDISTTGTTLALADDATSAALNLGFTFNYGGTNYTQVRVGSNGLLFFTATTFTTFLNTDFPFTGADAVMAPFWDDLIPRSVATRIRYQTLGSAPNRVFVVSWLNVPHWCNTASSSGCNANSETTAISYTFQVQIREDGSFVYWYQSMSGLGGNLGPPPNMTSGSAGIGDAGATIGAEVDDTDYTRYSFNTDSISNGSAILFTKSGAIAEYAMEQASWPGAGSVLDTSGSGNNASPITAGGATAPTPVFPTPATPPNTCRAANFPSNTTAALINAIDTGINVDAVAARTGTITFWFKSNANWNAANSQAQLFDATTTSNRWFFLTKLATGALYFAATDSGNTNRTVQTGANAFAANTWHHIAVTWNFRGGAILRVYIDGVQQATGATGANPLSASVGTLYIGDNRSGNIGLSGTANSANGQIDEFRMYANERSAAEIAADMNAVRPCVDHYAISFPNGATAVTCESLNVRITAHDSSHNAVTVPTGAAMTFNTTTGTGVWLTPVVTGTGTWTPSGSNNGQATYTWPGGESVVEVRLRHTTAVGSIGLNLGGAYTETAAEDPNATFVDAAFRVTDSAAAAAVSIGTQIAGKNSNTGFNAQTLFLQAIRTDTNTGSCTGVFPSQTVNVDLASECNNPAVCVPSPGSQMSVRRDNGAMVAIAQNNNGAVGSYTSVPLAFDAQSKASLVVNYPDAGQITLRARYALPSPPASTFMTGASNAFVVRPFGFRISGPPSGRTGSGSTVFTAAGQSFDTTLTAVVWEAADDSDNDGVPDSQGALSGNAATPNFGLETAPATATLSHALAEPSGGNAGALSGATTFSSFSAGARTQSVAFSEVGLVNLRAQTSNYLGGGQDITAGTSGLTGVGRFIPHHFQIDSVVPPMLANRALVLPCSSSFTYMGEPMRMTFRLLSQNAQNAVTQNYTGTFAKLDPTTPAVFAFGARSGTINLTSRITAAYPGAAPAWSNGVLDIPVANPLHVSIGRSTSGPDGVYAGTQFGVAPTDSDGVVMASYDLDVDNNATNDHAAVGGTTEVRYGRLSIQNAFGSELTALGVPMRVEYYTVSSGFVTNTGDSCTSVTNLSLSNTVTPTPVSGNAPLTKTVGTTNTTATIGNPTFVAGDAGLSFGAPGAGGDGYVDVTANLGATDWLKFDWDGNAGTPDTGPTGRATFGIYRGSPRHIYLRERY